MKASVTPIRMGLGPRLVLVLALIVAAGLLLLGTVRAQTSGGGELAACVARQHLGDTPRALLSDPGHFDCRKDSSAWGPGSYWVRLAVPATPTAVDPANPATILRLVPQWQRSLTVYSRDATGQILSRSFDNAELTPMVGIGGAIGVPLGGQAGPVTDVLLRIDGALNAAGLVGDPRLVSTDRLHADELVATALFAAFAGLGLGLFCYNIVLWLTIRERFQLTYCLSLLAMLAYVWSSSGTMAVQFPLIPNDVRMATSYAMLAFVAALALQFVTDIIEPEKVPTGLRLFARHYGLVFVATALSVGLVPDAWRPVAERAFVYSFLPLPPLVLAVTWIAWRRGSRSVRILAIAWALPLVMSVVRIAHALHLIHSTPLVHYSLVIGMSFEALLSSLAMSYRIKLIAAERDRAIIDERAARHLASVDSLTGLLNRRALLEQVIAWGSPEPLRLLIVDVDHFKQINDTHGHLVGDEVLRAFAEVLAIRADLRASVARLGGEEFALVGTVDELHEALALGILADTRARAMYGEVRITVSVGMAEGMVRSEDEWRELYRRADAALYQAKAEGRNRAIHALREGPASQPGIGFRAVA